MRRWICPHTHIDRYRGLPVMLALECLPDGAPLSRPEAGLHRRHRGPADGACPDYRPDALAAALLRGTPQGPTTGLWLVPHAVELCHIGSPRQAKHGLEVSAWTVRRWLHDLGWVWKRAKRVAKDSDPQRVERLARMRWHAERLQAHEVMVFADALDIHVLPKVGAAWMPKGSQEEVMTPGKNAKHYLAGVLNRTTGKILHCRGPRQTNALFRDLLSRLDRTYPERWVRRISCGIEVWL